MKWGRGVQLLQYEPAPVLQPSRVRVYRRGHTGPPENALDVPRGASRNYPKLPAGTLQNRRCRAQARIRLASREQLFELLFLRRRKGEVRRHCLEMSDPAFPVLGEIIGCTPWNIALGEQRVKVFVGHRTVVIRNKELAHFLMKAANLGCPPNRLAVLEILSRSIQ